VDYKNRAAPSSQPADLQRKPQPARELGQPARAGFAVGNQHHLMAAGAQSVDPSGRMNAGGIGQDDEVQRALLCDNSAEFSHRLFSVRMTKDMIDLAAPKERAFLVAVDTGDDPGWTAEESIGSWQAWRTPPAQKSSVRSGRTAAMSTQLLRGKGKVDELVAAKSETGYTVLIADDELSPAQQRALEEA